MTSDPIYMDHNATTPVAEVVVDAMIPFLREHFGNPSSGHVYGVRAHDAVERARGQVAALLGCEAHEVVFTSGGTEANNLAIRGATHGARRHIVTSNVEHPATSRPVEWLERQGFRVTRVPVGADGSVEADEVADALGPDTALVTIMHANNETGVLQPIAEVADRVRSSGAVFHTDAAQSVGKVPVTELGVDLLSIAGHKLYAPKGIGALWVRRGTDLAPLLLGAGHEGGVRPGTENVASIVGLGAACELARTDLLVEAERVKALRDRLWRLLAEEIVGLALNGGANRLPNTLNVRFPRVAGNAVLAGAPSVAASTGSACHAGEEQASSVIVAMGVPPGEALSSVRLTLGRGTTPQIVDTAAASLVAAWKSLVGS